jgi:hypothetical protein
MKTLTKAGVTKPASRQADGAASKRVRRIIRAGLPALPRTSALYGLDDVIGAVSIGAPSDKLSRRRMLRARIHADNHR